MNYNEPILIKLDEVNTNSIKKGVEYQIIKDINKDNCYEMIFGENILVLNKHGICFTMEDHEPFKFYRGILSLETQTNLYIDFAKKYFSNKEGFTVDASCEEEDIFMSYSIELNYDSADVNNFIDILVDFEAKFNEKLTNVEDEVMQIINK